MNVNFVLSDAADAIDLSGEDWRPLVVEVEASWACRRRSSSCSRSCCACRKPSVRDWLRLSTHFANSSEVARIAVNPLPINTPSNQCCRKLCNTRHGSRFNSYSTEGDFPKIGLSLKFSCEQTKRKTENLQFLFSLQDLGKAKVAKVEQTGMDYIPTGFLSNTNQSQWLQNDYRYNGTIVML